MTVFVCVSLHIATAAAIPVVVVVVVVVEVCFWLSLVAVVAVVVGFVGVWRLIPSEKTSITSGGQQLYWCCDVLYMTV